MDANLDVSGLTPLLGYGWRIGPAPRSPWYLGARIEGMAVTEPELAGGYLVGMGDAGVQIFKVIAEVGLGFGALGLGSFEDGEVAPAGIVETSIGYRFRDHLRLLFLRVSGTFPVLPTRTELQAGAFVGVGVEWSPRDQPPP